LESGASDQAKKAVRGAGRGTAGGAVGRGGKPVPQLLGTGFSRASEPRMMIPPRMRALRGSVILLAIIVLWPFSIAAEISD